MHKSVAQRVLTRANQFDESSVIGSLVGYLKGVHETGLGRRQLGKFAVPDDRPSSPCKVPFTAQAVDNGGQ